MGGMGGRYEPDHYIDYELSSKSEPAESPKPMKGDMKDSLATLKTIKESLAQESSEKSPK